MVHKFATKVLDPPCTQERKGVKELIYEFHATNTQFTSTGAFSTGTIAFQ